MGSLDGINEMLVTMKRKVFNSQQSEYEVSTKCLTMNETDETFSWSNDRLECITMHLSSDAFFS